MHLLRLGSLLGVMLLVGCTGEPGPQPLLARVKVQRVVFTPFAPEVTFTGSIQAQVHTELSFRVSGKIIERHVEVGEHVRAGQLLARLDAQEQQSNLLGAQAVQQAAQIRLQQAVADFDRQAALLPKGYTSRSEYDQALAAKHSAQSLLQAAQAQCRNSAEQIVHTELRSSADGVITSRQAEIGQVVQAASPVFGLAANGSLDAVFDVYEGVLSQPVELPSGIEVTLLDDPSVRSRGHIREVTPTVAERSGTVQVKVALDAASARMPLGAAVKASYVSGSHPNVLLPPSSLSSVSGETAVWLLDKQGHARLQPVHVASYGDGWVVIDSGLHAGQRVVVAGGQALYPGIATEVAGNTIADQSAMP